MFSLNGVREDMRHVLNAKTSKCRCLMAQQMYDAVRSMKRMSLATDASRASSPYTVHPQGSKAPQVTITSPVSRKPQPLQQPWMSLASSSRVSNQTLKRRKVHLRQRLSHRRNKGVCTFLISSVVPPMLIGGLM